MPFQGNCQSNVITLILNNLQFLWPDKTLKKYSFVHCATGQEQCFPILQVASESSLCVPRTATLAQLFLLLPFAIAIPHSHSVLQCGDIISEGAFWFHEKSLQFSKLSDHGCFNIIVDLQVNKNSNDLSERISNLFLVSGTTFST